MPPRKISHCAVLWPKRFRENKFQARCAQVSRSWKSRPNCLDVPKFLQNLRKWVRKSTRRVPNPWPKQQPASQHRLRVCPTLTLQGLFCAARPNARQSRQNWALPVKSELRWIFLLLRKSPYHQPRFPRQSRRQEQELRKASSKLRGMPKTTCFRRLRRTRWKPYRETEGKLQRQQPKSKSLRLKPPSRMPVLSKNVRLWKLRRNWLRACAAFATARPHFRENILKLTLKSSSPGIRRGYQAKRIQK